MILVRPNSLIVSIFEELAAPDSCVSNWCGADFASPCPNTLHQYVPLPPRSIPQA